MHKFISIIVILIFIFTSLFPLGCALKPGRVALLTGQPPGRLLCGDALPKSIGIAPVIDARPEEEKTGKKADGLYLLVWNQRKGDYVSGNQDFPDFTPEGFTRMIHGQIERTNCFRSNKILNTNLPAQPAAENLLVVLAQEKVDYVLTSEIKHLFGSQSQNSFALIVPALFVNAAAVQDQVSHAFGNVQILFTLYSVKTGQEVWREMVNQQASSPVQGAYAEVVKEALAQANGALAERLHQFAASAQAPAI